MDPQDSEGGHTVNDVPTVHCSRCEREWDLEFELGTLSAGNRAVEQFALDHERHTGHFPDDVSPWIVDCRQCPDGDRFLSERPARRWAATHVRHTSHGVELRNDTNGTAVVIEDPTQGYNPD